jgi:hypothetical protein
MEKLAKSIDTRPMCNTSSEYGMVDDGIVYSEVNPFRTYSVPNTDSGQETKFKPSIKSFFKE